MYYAVPLILTEQIKVNKLLIIHGKKPHFQPLIKLRFFLLSKF